MLATALQGRGVEKVDYFDLFQKLVSLQKTSLLIFAMFNDTVAEILYGSLLSLSNSEPSSV